MSEKVWSCSTEHIASRSGHLSVGVQGLSVHVLHQCLRPHWFLFFGFWHPDCPADNLLFPFNLVFTEACTFPRCTLCSLLGSSYWNYFCLPVFSSFLRLFTFSFPIIFLSCFNSMLEFFFSKIQLFFLISKLCSHDNLLLLLHCTYINYITITPSTSLQWNYIFM